jgi:Xaa-Pro aminopeptidase
VAAKSKIQTGNRSRVDRLRLRFSELSADAILVTQFPNIRYLCGFSGSAGMLLVEQTKSTLFTDSRYTFQAKDEVFDARTEIIKGGLVRTVGEYLRRKRRRVNVAYSPSNMTVAQKDALHKFAPNVRWVPDGDAIEDLRSIKDASELADIRAAAELISDVFTDVVRGIKCGLSELELAARIEYGIKQRGGSGLSFDTIVAAGPRSAWAHAHPTSKLLGKNELVVLDQGAILRGYCSDMTRTVFVGKASKRVRGLYNAVLEAQEAAKKAIRPGVTAGAVDKAARSVLTRHGLGRYFTHSTGHGLGIEVHEKPRLGRGEKSVLQEGMVVTVEPGVYLEGVGGIRVEDDVVVTASGSSDLTTASREFFEL